MKAIGHWPEITFMKDHYEIKSFYGNRLEFNRSTLGRIRNQLVLAINEQILMPKIILVVLDDDIVHGVYYEDFGISNILGRLIHWLAMEFNKLVETQKDKLPPKAIRKGYPTFIWMAPPENINFNNNDMRHKIGSQHEINYLSATGTYPT